MYSTLTSAKMIHCFGGKTPTILHFANISRDDNDIRCAKLITDISYILEKMFPSGNKGQTGSSPGILVCNMLQRAKQAI